MSKSAKFLGAALLALTLASPLRAADMTAETVLATVNGEDITLGQMIAARKALPEQYQQLPDDVLFKGLLEQLIQQTAMAQVGEKNKTQLDDLNMVNQKRAYFSGGVLEAAAQAGVSEEALKKAYDDKYAKAVPAKEYDASHILVKTEEEAKAIKAELDKGGDFAAIAKEKSEDKGTAANGGSLGWFSVGMMVKPFEDAVVALEKGKTSEPVKSDFGWHIIHLNDVRDAAVPKLEDVKAELEGDLRQKAVEAKVKELTDAAKVEKKDEGVDPAILKNLALIGQ
ncbi:MAG: peptidylprolyl isomerase [Paracoccaceae bacterium]|jgi:peptidyl-prolyl cis-trans isomerase C